MLNEFDRYKPKHTSPQFEDIKLKKVYAFTFNPKDAGVTCSQLLFRQDAYVLREIKGIFASLSHAVKSAKITIAVESSSTGRIHCHGWIIIEDYIDWVSEIKMLTNLGTICIKEIDDSNTWEEYAFKQSLIWKPFFEKHKLAYPYSVPILNTVPDPLGDDEEPRFKLRPW